MRPLFAVALSLVAALCAAPAAAADVADYFAIYYRQEIARPHYAGPLDFLRDAAAAKKRPQQALAAEVSRSAVIDRRAGHLRIDDSSGTDQILTMALRPTAACFSSSAARIAPMAATSRRRYSSPTATG